MWLVAPAWAEEGQPARAPVGTGAASGLTAPPCTVGGGCRRCWREGRARWPAPLCHVACWVGLFPPGAEIGDRVYEEVPSRKAPEGGPHILGVRRVDVKPVACAGRDSFADLVSFDWGCLIQKSKCGIASHTPMCSAVFGQGHPHHKSRLARRPPAGLRARCARSVCSRCSRRAGTRTPSTTLSRARPSSTPSATPRASAA